MTQLNLFSPDQDQTPASSKIEKAGDHDELDCNDIGAAASQVSGEEMASAEISAEDEKLQVAQYAPAPVVPRRDRPWEPLRTAEWPAVLTWDRALQYTSLSKSELRRWSEKGMLRFRRIGPSGAKVVARADLDLLIAKLFGEPAAGIEEDFDFG